MPSVSPFRALRYDETVAGPLTDLVAPPYDVIDDAARNELLRRSPFNVVHLTLPDSVEAAAAELGDWRAQGVLEREEPALWWIAQDYTGPDGVARSREGIAGSVEATPYSEGQVLPHERTHAGPKEGRLKILRATRTQLEPIFLLYDADPPLDAPGGSPEMDVENDGVRTRVWRLPAEELEIDAPFLIADGHHRYETAVAFRERGPDRDPHIRRARLVALSGARDLPDAPDRSSARGGTVVVANRRLGCRRPRALPRRRVLPSRFE